MTDRHTADSITDDALDQLYDRAERAEAAITRARELANRWKQYGNTDLKRYASMLHAALDQPAPAATQATD